MEIDIKTKTVRIVSGMFFMVFMFVMLFIARVGF